MSKFYDRYKKDQEQKRLALLKEESDRKMQILRSITLFYDLKRCRTFVVTEKLKRKLI